jgi:non-canonical (house-cleaning) NTP pyrophosphatase
VASLTIFVALNNTNIHYNKGRTQVGRSAGLQPPPNPQNRNLKGTDFVDVISKVLRDFPFSRNQPLKSADD